MGKSGDDSSMPTSNDKVRCTSRLNQSSRLEPGELHVVQLALIRELAQVGEAGGVDLGVAGDADELAVAISGAEVGSQRAGRQRGGQ